MLRFVAAAAKVKGSWVSIVDREMVHQGSYILEGGSTNESYYGNYC